MRFDAVPDNLSREPLPSQNSFTRACNLLYFHYIGIMESNIAIDALSALAQETRLAIFRRLVELGPDGAPAGRIADDFGLPGATLSFHLNQLKQAGLVNCQRDGRSLIYSANFTVMNSLIGYLMENCCRDQDRGSPLPDAFCNEATIKGN